VALVEKPQLIAVIPVSLASVCTIVIIGIIVTNRRHTSIDSAVNSPASCRVLTAARSFHFAEDFSRVVPVVFQRLVQ